MLDYCSEKKKKKKKCSSLTKFWFTPHWYKQYIDSITAKNIMQHPVIVCKHMT